MSYVIYLIIIIAVWGFTYGAYLGLSKGLSASARHQQASRFAIGAILAVAPAAVTELQSVAAPLWYVYALSAAWMLTFPPIDLATRRHHATEIDNKLDFAFGLYLAGWLSAAWLACQAWVPGSAVASVAFAVVEYIILAIILLQWTHFVIYGAGINHDGLRLAMNTYPSEIWEFIKSFPLWGVIAGFVAAVGISAAWFYGAITAGLTAGTPDTPAWCPWVEAALFIALSFITFRGSHSPWRRSGIVALYYDNRDYLRQINEYTSKAPERRQALGDVARLPRRGRTFVLVIGESASRDYMSAFTPQPGGIDTTPWLSARAADPATVLFDNAYSCHFQTVPTLTRALTAANQKNGLTFAAAPSVVDAAHALGLTVHWYSNQSHIGANDTPVSLMAESADKYAWTRLALTRIPYDDTLMEFLPEVKPDTDNLIVLHLKGSHFNYESRYPAERAIVVPRPGKEGYVDHYHNSLAFTDSVLRQVWEYCTEHLNLAAMIYCSDHADIPTSRRSPVFNGIERLRIPLFVALSPEYAAENPALAKGLREMRHDLFVNDFLYDLTLSVLSPDAFPLPHPQPPLLSLLGTLPLPGQSPNS